MKTASDSRKKRKCWDIDEDVPFLKEQYLRFALVSNQRYIDKLNISDRDTLVISCDWQDKTIEKIYLLLRVTGFIRVGEM